MKYVLIIAVVILIGVILILPCRLQKYEDIRDYLIIEYPRYTSIKRAFEDAELIIIGRTSSVTSDWKLLLTYVKIDITMTIKGSEHDVITVVQHRCKTPWCTTLIDPIFKEGEEVLLFLSK